MNGIRTLRRLCPAAALCLAPLAIALQPAAAVDLSVAANQDGRLQLFVIATDGTVRTRYQLGPDSAWSSWDSFPGPQFPSGKLVSIIGAGGLLVLLHQVDSQTSRTSTCYLTVQDAPNDTNINNWNGWYYNTPPQPAQDSRVAVTADRAGTIWVFCRGTKPSYTVTSERLIPSTQKWLAFQAPPDLQMDGCVSSPAVGQNEDGRLEVFMREQDGGIYHCWQMFPDMNWSGWVAMGGQMVGDPAVGHDADGRLEVFARGQDGAIYGAWQLAPNGGWSSWYNHGSEFAGDPVAFTRPDGRLELFVRGPDGSISTKWQVQPNGGWSDWDNLGGNAFAGPVVAAHPNGRLEAFIMGPDGKVYRSWEEARAITMSGWHQWVGEDETGYPGGSIPIVIPPPPPAPSVTHGDLNGDGTVTVADAILALKIAVGLLQPTSGQLAAGDLDQSGAISVAEVLLILRAAVGLSTLP